jgi:hypothetical protein
MVYLDEFSLPPYHNSCGKKEKKTFTLIYSLPHMGICCGGDHLSPVSERKVF